MTRKQTRKPSLFAQSASALAIGLLRRAAWAQETDAPESDRTLATVTVKTRRPRQSLRMFPIAFPAFDEDAIRPPGLNRGATS